MTALAVIGAGFASSLGHVLWVIEAWTGIIVTASAAAVVVLCLLATRGQQKPLTGAGPEVGDDTLTMLSVDDEIEQWLREGGHHG